MTRTLESSSPRSAQRARGPNCYAEAPVQCRRQTSSPQLGDVWVATVLDRGHSAARIASPVKSQVGKPVILGVKKLMKVTKQMFAQPNKAKRRIVRRNAKPSQSRPKECTTIATNA